MCSIEREHKETEVKAAVKLFQNRDPMMKLMCDFEKHDESVGLQSLTKEAAKYAGKYGLQLKFQYPDPACVTEEGEVIPREKLKSHLTNEQELGLKGDVGAQKRQGTLVTAREEEVAEHCAMLLLANQVVIMPITYSGGYVQIKGTAFTHLIVCHPQDTHESEQ